MSYSTSYVFIASAAGLTADLRAQFLDTNSDNVGSEITTGFSYVGAGEGGAHFYQLHVAIPDGHQGAIIAYDTNDPTVILMPSAINQRELENADAKVSLTATASALTTVANGVAAILEDTGTTGVVISTSVMQALADVVLGRSVATVEGTASTHSLAEVILGLLESTTAGTTWTIKRTDGSTTFNTRTLTLDSAALPVTGVA